MPDNNNLTMAATTTFHPFPRLPAEIQHQIWGWAFFATGRVYWMQGIGRRGSVHNYCIHSLMDVCLKKCWQAYNEEEFPSYPFEVSSYGPFEWCAEYISGYGRTSSFEVERTSSLPALLWVSHDSRRGALRVWSKLHNEHVKHYAEYAVLRKDLCAVGRRLCSVRGSGGIGISLNDCMEWYLFEKASGTEIQDSAMAQAVNLQRLLGEKIRSIIPGRPSLGELKKWKIGSREGGKGMR